MSTVKQSQVAYELTFVYTNSRITITKESQNLLLSPTGRLNDAIIEAYMSSLAKGDKDIFVLPSLTATNIALNKKHNLKISSRLSEYLFISGPVFHENCKHWTLILIFVDMENSFFYYFDSLNNYSNEYLTVYNNWKFL